MNENIDLTKILKDCPYRSQGRETYNTTRGRKIQTPKWKNK